MHSKPTFAIITFKHRERGGAVKVVLGGLLGLVRIKIIFCIELDSYPKLG